MAHSIFQLFQLFTILFRREKKILVGRPPGQAAVSTLLASFLQRANDVGGLSVEIKGAGGDPAFLSFFVLNDRAKTQWVPS